MTAKIASSRYLQIKKYGYWFFISIICMPYFSAIVGSYFNVPNVAAYFTLVYAFIIVPVLDHLIGHDLNNPDPAIIDDLSKQSYYKWVTLACLPLQYTALLFGAFYFMHADLNLLGAIGWVISVGVVTSSIGITVAHELIHKNSKLERVAGGLLLSSVCYATFKVEHVRGHHVWVGTPLDHTTAKFNQTVYQFLRQVIPHNFFSAWRLEAEKLKRKGLEPFSTHNELIWWYTISGLIAVTLTLFFGWKGLIFFVLQSAVAILVLEMINYVEHYGLARKALGNGMYEPVNEGHSWDSDFLLTNLMLFQLQRHSDHHYKPKHRYQILLRRDKSPQLPSGYPLMMILAMFPPLWFKIINPLVPKSNFHPAPAADSSTPSA